MERAASSQDPDPPAAGLAGARAAGGRRILARRAYTNAPRPHEPQSRCHRRRSREIGQCLRQRLGITPCAFAYPCGRMTPAVIERVAASFACGVAPPIIDPSALPNSHSSFRGWICYYQAPGRLEAWGTSAFKRHLAFIRRRRRAVAAGGVTTGAALDGTANLHAGVLRADAPA